MVLWLASFLVASASAHLTCPGALGPPFLREEPAPAGLMLRPTRLQKLLETIPFRELTTEHENPAVRELFDPAHGWMTKPSFAAQEYFRMFSIEDLLLMAAHPAYAKKVAGDLRTYANLHRGVFTSNFRNDDVMNAAQLLADRHRLLTRGIPRIETRADLEAEARHAGLKVRVQNSLSYLSSVEPEVLRAGPNLTAEGDRHDSILGSFARRSGGERRAPQGRFIPLYSRLEYDLPFDNVVTDPNEARRIFAAALTAELGQKDWDASPLCGYNQIRGLKECGLYSVETALARLESLEVVFTYQYLLKKIPAIKLSGAFGQEVGLSVAAAVATLPTERIETWRRIYRISFEFQGYDQHGRDREKLIRRSGLLHHADPWN